jgi:hypothetical protein
MRHEKGKNAVGASKLYAQITNEEWERISKLAEQAYQLSTNELIRQG